MKKPLTDAQLRVLLQTPYDEMTGAFPGLGRPFLRHERERARKKFGAALAAEAAPDPLTDEQLKLLLRTAQDDWGAVFKGFPRTFLRQERVRAKAKFPVERKVVADALPVTAGIDDLSDPELKLLLDTKEDDWGAVFQGYPKTFLRRERERARAVFPPELFVDLDAKKKLEGQRLREVDRLYQATQRELEATKKQLALALDFPELSPRNVAIKSTAGRREATALALASDWHCEEEVTLESTNGLNEYNLEVFDYRSRWFFANTLKLLKKEAEAVDINHLVLAVLGDMFSGAIHQDIRTLLGQTQAVALAGDTIAGGIKQILRETPKSFTLTVVFKWGNHSRTTKEQMIASESDFSLEWLMAHHIAQLFKDEPRVRIVREQALLTYVKVYDFMVRFLHGHAIGYQGGVGGITIPIRKALMEWDKGIKADLTVLGHFHQYLPARTFIVNGSMIGWNPFATWVKAAPEKPVQSFALIDSKHGLTMQAPILLEDA